MIGPTNLCFTCKNRTKNEEGWWACLFYGEIPEEWMMGGKCPHYKEYGGKTLWIDLSKKMAKASK